MKVLSVKNNEAEVKLTVNELLVLNAVLNEVCNGIDIAEFETRIGSEKEWVTDLLSEVSNLLDRLSIN